MYSTKYLNKNMVDNNAYITVNDPYKDPLPNTFRQPKKGDKPVKPFQIKQHPENEENGHFSKVVYASSPYMETNLYITTQPLDGRKKGFGSKDAHRRDEFSNAVRTEQYRESIRKEVVLRGDSIDDRMKSILEKHQQEPIGVVAKKQFQFDIGRSKVTDFDPKCNRDSFYKVCALCDRPNLGVAIYVCIHVCVYVCKFACIFSCIYIYIFLCTYACLYT